jgi:hypothetical protein
MAFAVSAKLNNFSEVSAYLRKISVAGTAREGKYTMIDRVFIV